MSNVSRSAENCSSISFFFSRNGKTRVWRSAGKGTPTFQGNERVHTLTRIVLFTFIDLWREQREPGRSLTVVTAEKEKSDRLTGPRNERSEGQSPMTDWWK